VLYAVLVGILLNDDAAMLTGVGQATAREVVALLHNRLTVIQFADAIDTCIRKP